MDFAIASLPQRSALLTALAILRRIRRQLPDSLSPNRAACSGLRCIRIPECLMAVFTDILQSATDFDERSGVLFLSGRQHFEAHTAQGPGEGIECFALVP